ncbi:hypothetical protein ACFLQU_00955 [Verrucomicrobiota bacterium]
MNHDRNTDIAARMLSGHSQREIAKTYGVSHRRIAEIGFRYLQRADPGAYTEAWKAARKRLGKKFRGFPHLEDLREQGDFGLIDS